MNKIKLTFLAFTLSFIALISFTVLSYIEHERVASYGKLARELGHEVLNMRDQITNSAITGISNPYQLSANLVHLEKELQKLRSSYQEKSIHSPWFNKLPTRQILERFYDSSMTNIDTLDHLVGQSVARQFILQSLTQKLTDNNTSKSMFKVQSELLANVLQTEPSLANQEENAKHEGSTSPTNAIGRLNSHPDFVQLIETFTDLNIQQQLLLSNILSDNSMQYVEVAEHGFTDLQNSLKSLIIKLIFSITALIFAFSFAMFIMRIFELKRNTLAYQEAASTAQHANEAKSLFLATMSHELRTPMNGVLGLAQIIKSDSQEPETRKQAQVIIDSGQHLVTILDDILDFSKVEQGKLELEFAPFSVCDVVTHLDKTLTPLAENKGLSLIINDNIPSNIQLIGDSARTRQILFNLAGNAVKFTESGKVEIQFDLSNTTPPTVNIRVSDTGIGIDESKIDHIFTAFEQAELSTTRKFGGTGLGLSIVKQLVKLMGGDINVSSQLNVGTHFNITLPLKLQKLASQITKVTEPENTTIHENFSVLLVEDNKVNAMVIRKFCESLNLTVDNAFDGLQALDKLSENQYDLIIMDNHMPNMSGIEAIRKIRNELKLSTVIFACTADVFKEAHDDFLSSGANFVLTKPLQKNSLKNAIIEFHKQFEVNRTHLDIDGTNMGKTQNEGNVTILTRCPKNQLPMTEEELTRNPLLVGQNLDLDEKLDYLESIVSDLEHQIDALIDMFSNSQTEELNHTLLAVKGVAAELQMSEVLELASSAESTTRNNILPEAELLQQLINRLMVNSHQATRLIHKLNQQRKTG
ncbi:ATP-binding protein [Vibrio sp. SNU_ST1]|uniref:ATP-binding protein n=1 Tax=Vibrio sp. SNU_ST1 TaxID=3064001 RepID=UPI00272A1062|nr:ATP-binding protein [Vibrio sp. SNU_ST1]WKY59576.1 ATP-binding protein [Vibrio sp. SNU_ST1]